MKAIDHRVGPQGDIGFVEIDEIPDGCAKMTPVNGKYILAHSETGHHHSIVADACEALQDPRDPNVCYLQMFRDADVLHERGYDTHTEKAFIAGKKYIGIRQGEAGIDGEWRRAAD